MLKHITYICSPSFLADIEQTLRRLGARDVIQNEGEQAVKLTLSHRLIGDFVLQISLLADISKLSSHLRKNPVDLLIYDERGEGSLEADIALKTINNETKKLAEQWGPDFLFPTSRTLTILNQEKDLYHRILELGRFHTKDVIVAPNSTPQLIREIHKVLKDSFKPIDKVGCALSGGGVEGFLYQVGTLYAIDRALSSKRLKDCNLFSGISSGSIAASILATGCSLKEIILAIEGKSDVLKPLKSSTLFDVATKEVAKHLLNNTKEFKVLSPSKWVKLALNAFPTGIFAGKRLEEYIEHVLEEFKIHDNLNIIDKELFIGATEQSQLEHVIFGYQGQENVKISEAVRASCALPPLYMPKEINGKKYIDGQVTRTANLELAVERGCGLVFIVDPLKPTVKLEKTDNSPKGGIFTTIQVLKVLLSTRFESTLKHVSTTFPDVEFLVFQPSDECEKLMSGSPMKYRIRRKLVRYAYESTMKQIIDRHDIYASKLIKFGFNLNSPEQINRIIEEDNQFFDWN